MTLGNNECGLESEKPRRPFATLQIHGQEERCGRLQKIALEVKTEKENVEKFPKKRESVVRSPQREPEKCESFYADSVLLKDIYSHQKQLESKCCPLFGRSVDKISIEMRSAFIDWLIFKAECFALHTSTLHLAVHYADNYFCKEEVDVKDLPVLGSCAILLASKFEEARDNIPKVEELIKHASNAFSRREVFRMEQKMLKALDFKMAYPTIYLFLQIFCDMLNIVGEEAFLAQYICEIALIFEDVSFYNVPSQIAAASLLLVRYLLGLDLCSRDIEKISGYSATDLAITGKLLFDKLDKITGTEFKRVITKYSSSSYANVADNYHSRIKYKLSHNAYEFVFRRLAQHLHGVFRP